MEKRSRSGFIVIAMAALIAALPHVSRAALGGPEATLADDALQLKGSIKATERTNYRVHEVQLPSGTLLREFASLDGKVFAVAWTGPTLPNLRQALGTYFDEYVTAAQAIRGGRHHIEVKQSDLVVQSGGHMRRFSGRAYLPQALPAGLSLDELH
jgi:aldehyde:ferredoxin oxidoreductase